MISHDDALIQKARQRDPEAFREIYRLNYEPVYNYIFFRTGDKETAEDLCGEVFVRAVEHAPSLRSQGRPLLAWLYTIARNLLVDYRRKNGRHQQYPITEEIEAAPMPDPAVTAERNIVLDKLKCGLQELTEEQQIVIILKFIESRSNKEVAEILGKTEGAIKSMQHRALASLQRYLSKEGYYEQLF